MDFKPLINVFLQLIYEIFDMLTRRHLRVKVMQQLYANTISYPFELKVAQHQLELSNKGFFELYLLMLNMFIEVQKCGRSLHKIVEKQYLKANIDQLNPKFFSNKIISKLSKSKILESKTSKFKINYWKEHDEYVRLIWDQIVKSDRYAEYLSENESSFVADKAALIDLFTEVIAPYDRLHELIEEIKPSWVDDFPLVNTIVRNTLFHMQEDTDPEDLILTSTYKDKEDRTFAMDLFKSVVVNDKLITTQLEGRTHNWEQDRIAVLDMVLLKLAIAEFLYFPSIPSKVTINEYLEIAKEYATPKSSMFINGILDVISKELERNGSNNKKYL